MKPFLSQVAGHYLSGGDISRTCFVFPNRRSIAFFRKYLAEAVRERTEALGAAALPEFAPELVTVNDLFARAYGDEATDKVTLLLELYDCYHRISGSDEPLDEFIFWGDIILSDFGDVDKYLASPSQIFTNVAEFKDMQDDFSYLSERQREAICAFVDHFNPGSRKLTVDVGRKKGKDVKKEFLQIWNILLPLYEAFNAQLREKGFCHEGMIYRSLAERVSAEPVSDVLKAIFPRCERYVFVGLNTLNECEKTVLRKMRNAGMAHFCWDFSGPLISDPLNRASFFMKGPDSLTPGNLDEFPMDEDLVLDPDGTSWDNGRSARVQVLSVPSGIAQTKQLDELLRRMGIVSDESGNASVSSDDCAIVLPDESLLMPLLNTIPPSVREVNVTMGCPLAQSEFAALMADVVAMQLHVNAKGNAFYYKPVWSIFSNGIIKKILQEDEASQEVVKRVKASAKYNIPLADLACEGLFSILFRPVLHSPSEASDEQNKALADYILSAISAIAARMTKNPDMALEVQFAAGYYSCVASLRRHRLDILPLSYFKLLVQLVATVSVPFKGEPLKGLQIMGPLETRALDFRNIVILSCNEGIFPRRNVSSSFIPPELRRAFSLPTYEHQDAMWAYYFYRMITRAENVWMLYDSRAEGTNSGEESRYIKQLDYHFGVPVERYVAKAPLKVTDPESPTIEKTPEDVAAIRKLVMSATTIESYLSCPAKFYYAKVKGLKKEEEVSENVDAGTMGTVFHDTMWSLYHSERAMSPSSDLHNHKEAAGPGFETITRDFLSSWLGRENDIRAKVKSMICMALRTDEVSGRDLVVANVICRYIMQTLKCEISQLAERGLDSFRIVSLEKNHVLDHLGFRIKGLVDRIDSFGDGVYRVVDYKTGGDDPAILAVPEGSEEEIADMLFDPQNDNMYKVKAGVQFYIYDIMVRECLGHPLEKMQNCMYAMTKIFTETPATQPVNPTFVSLMDRNLGRMFEEMTDLSVPFARTENEKACEFCDFRIICGR